MKTAGLMIDCSRNAVRKPEAVKRMADIMSRLGFNALLLYTEDTYEIEGEPYFGYLRGRYTKAELRDMDDYCAGLGIELIPCIQTLAHLNGIVRWREYEDITDVNDILLAGEEKTYKLIRKMFKTVSETFTSGKIHIGMDEAWMLGAGKYLRKNGYTPQLEIMKAHLARVSELAAEYGLEPMMWSDMFFQAAVGEALSEDADVIDDAVRAAMPENITPVYWDYYSTDKTHYDNVMKAHKRFGKPFWFAGGLWTWTGFTPHNLYSMRASSAALKSCMENGVENVFFTMWGDNGAETSMFSILPSLCYVSQVIKGDDGDDAIKRAFKELTGIELESFLNIDIPGITFEGENKNKTVNPDKYTLYNDCFLGIFDSIVNRGNTEIYRETSRRLSKLEDNGEYGYIFKTARSLCDVLEVKNELGLNIRDAYRAGDKIRLGGLAGECRRAAELAEAFLENLRVQWYRENKPFGFEVQETRIGGLACRLRSCAVRLELYADGQMEKIDELEEDILDPECDAGSGPREIWATPWNKYFVNII